MDRQEVEKHLLWKLTGSKPRESSLFYYIYKNLINLFYFKLFLSLYWLFSGSFFVDFFFAILYFIAENKLILIKQLLKSLLIFKSKYSNKISDKSYEILFFYKMIKDIILYLKLLLTFTHIPCIYFWKNFINKIRKIYRDILGYIFEGTH